MADAPLGSVLRHVPPGARLILAVHWVRAAAAGRLDVWADAVVGRTVAQAERLATDPTRRYESVGENPAPLVGATLTVGSARVACWWLDQRISASASHNSECRSCAASR